MEFRVLGPLEARDRGQPVDLGTPRVRTLLATLLLQANRVVSIDELVERMWGERPPDKPRRTVQTNVARLRLALDGHGRAVQTRESGYLIEVDQWQLDLLRFRALVGQAHPGEEPERRRRLLGQALELWRGEPLAGMTAEILARDEVPRLAEERLTAQESLIDVRLGLGQHAELIPELTALTGRHPLRERLWAYLMLALFRSSRQAEALHAYRELSRTLADELGLDPTDELQRLHRAVLTGDPALTLPSRAVSPARPSWTVQCQLPLDVADFVGRGSSLGRIDDLLSIGGMPVVTVAGPPGVGKTALAVRAAHRLRWRFSDGQWYVRLGGAFGPRDPSDVLADLLRTSGMDPVDVPERLDARAAAFRSRLADRKVLLVFDDAAGADQVEPLLPGTSGCAVLVTTRCSLAALAARYPVHEITLDVLPPADARTLVTRVLRAGRRRVEPALVAELADLCGRLPLALRISAATLVSRPSTPAGEWIGRLRTGNRLATLAIDGSVGSAVRSAFDQAHAALGGDLRRLLGLLGLVPGPDVTVPAVAALLGADHDLAERQLDGLVAANLLHRHGDRFSFHDLLRLYAADRAAAEPDAGAAWNRLCDWYLHTAVAAMSLDGPNPVPLPRPAAGGHERFPTATRARAWLDAERANLVAAAVRAGGPFAWHLADTLTPYLQRGQYAREWEATASAGLRSAEAAGYRLGEAAMHRSLGGARQRSGGPLIAIRHLTAALDRYEDGTGASGAVAAARATTLCGLGYNHFLAGDMRAALAALDRGVTLIRELDRADLLGTALNLCGVVQMHSGELGTALHSATTGLEIDGAPRTLLYINRGEVRRVLGDYPGALADASQGLALARRAGIRRQEAFAHDALARIRLDTGHLDLARQHAERVLHLARVLDDAWFEAGALITIGDVYRLRGMSARAGERYARAVRLAIGSGSRIHEAEARLSFAVSDLANGRAASARGRAEVALDIAERAGLRLVACQASHLLAAIGDRVGDAPASAAHAARAAELQAETGYHPPPHLPVLTAATRESASPGR
jgi:DNA-binding SARP family transcriptional activator/tetratricopeptide (TPR) repeat protein